VVEQIEAFAKDKGCTPSQLALAWLLTQGTDIVPIPGTTSLARLEENLAAPGIVLTPPELERIEQVSPKGVATGERYHPSTQSMLDR
jgi:aryl-alcohol dehydrogenase-like predicted oxidoreductase